MGCYPTKEALELELKPIFHKGLLPETGGIFKLLDDPNSKLNERKLVILNTPKLLHS